jgi:hypothetical protein
VRDRLFHCPLVQVVTTDRESLFYQLRPELAVIFAPPLGGQWPGAGQPAVTGLPAALAACPGLGKLAAVPGGHDRQRAGVRLSLLVW